jgi:glycosyltransferase involved in cell wall biosynthesis
VLEAVPFVSFLTTVYRTEDYLPAMIESVLAQTSPAWELVIVDNGRSDTVVHVVDQYAADPRIRLIRQENRGYRGGVTAAAEVAVGRYLSVLDSDDRIMPEFVSTMARVIDLDPAIDAVGCDAVQFSDSEQARLSTSYLDSVGVRWQTRYEHEGLTLTDALSGVIPYYTGIVRRQAWHAVGGYANADADVDESVTIWLRLVRRYDVRVIDASLGWYRIREGSLSREPAKVGAFEEALIAAFSRPLESEGSPADRRAVAATVSRLRFYQEMRRARWALLDGDSEGARRHARQAYRCWPGPRSAVVVGLLAVSPGLLRRIHPYKQRAAAVWLRSRERMAVLSETAKIPVASLSSLAFGKTSTESHVVARPTGLLKVIHVGPGLNVRGGVSAVEILILEATSGRTPVEHIATMVEGNPLLRLRVFVSALHRLRAALKYEQPLVLHIHFASRGSTLRKYIVARMVLRTPARLVLHAHGAAFDTFFLGLPGFLRRRLASLLKESDAVIALSSQWQEFFATCVGVPRERIWVLVNPTKLPAVYPDRSERDRVQFLFIGRIGRRKGAFDLLQAYQALPHDVRARASIVFAGDGRTEQLREQARLVGPDVTVHSWLGPEERDRLLAASDILALPSRNEGVPMAILEAMAYGLPVIATPVGGIPDVITDQKEGLLVEVGDTKQLTSAMARVILDHELRGLMGGAAKARAESLDIAQYTRRLEDLYGAVTRKPRR